MGKRKAKVRVTEIDDNVGSVEITLPRLFLYCGVEQWSARWAHNPEVVGSNPSAATNFKLNKMNDYINKLEKHFKDYDVKISDEAFGWNGGDLSISPWYTADDYEVHVMTNDERNVDWENDVYYYEPQFEDIMNRIVDTVADAGHDVKIYVSDLETYLPEPDVLDWLERQEESLEVTINNHQA